LLLAVLGSIAEFERELIKSRCLGGIKRAKANGIRFGRKPKLSAFQITEAKRLRESGTSLVEIGRLLGVSHSTILRLG
jgi:DNA invertase Pin-like site-specific DNA recombinase